MKKKLLTLLLTCLFALSIVGLFACGASDNLPTNDEQYTVAFFDEDGELLESKKYSKGATPSYNYFPESDTEYDYEFKGWSLSANGEIIESLPVVSKDANYYAIVEKTERAAGVPYEEGCNDSESAKTTAAAYSKQLFDTNAANLTDNQKEELKVVLDSVLVEINALSGNVDTVKEKADELYKKLYGAINDVKKEGTTLREIIDAGVKRVETLYESAKKVVGNSREILNNAYERAQDVIASVNDINTAKTQIERAVKNFASTCKNQIETVIEQKTAALKRVVKGGIKTVYEAIVAKITNQTVLSAVKDFYDDKIAEIDGKTFEELSSFSEDIEKSINAFVSDKIKEIIAEVKTEAVQRLRGIIDEVLANISDEDVKTQINSYLQSKITEVGEIDDLEEAADKVAEIVKNVTDYVVQYAVSQIDRIKNEALSRLESAVNAALAKIEDETLRKTLTDFYAEQMGKISAIAGEETARATAEEIIGDTQDLIADVIAAQITKIKAAAKGRLDTLVETALAKIDDKDLQDELKGFYNTEIAKVEAINSIDTAKATAEEIIGDTQDLIADVIAAQITKIKVAARGRLDALVNTALAKIDDKDLQDELRGFYNTEIAKVEAINSIDTAKATAEEIIADTVSFAKKQVAKMIAPLRAEVKSYVNDVANLFSGNPYADLLPEAMLPSFDANLVAEKPAYDFTSFVDIADINYGGFGVQWQMVIESLEKNKEICKYLNVGGTTLNSALNILTQYLDSDECDDVNYQFENSVLSVAMALNNGTLDLSIAFKATLNIKLIGSVSPQIDISLDSATGNMQAYIKLTDNLGVRYIITENSYEGGVCAGISLEKLTSYCKIEKDNLGNVEGHIYQYKNVKDKDFLPACADFYVKDGYVIVVGNKADAIIGMDGYIVELYNSSEGNLLGYEVRETKTFLSIEADYNTLWFNIDDISGIESIKIGERTKSNKSDNSANDVYLNGSGELLAPTYNTKEVTVPIIGKVSKKTSRKYDIEFRTRYFYGIDAETGDIIEYEVEIPMLFIQEDNEKDTNFTDYHGDMLTDNGIDSNIVMSLTVLNKIKDSYHTYVEEFIQNKVMMGSTAIIEFIFGK